MKQGGGKQEHTLNSSRVVPAASGTRGISSTKRMRRKIFRVVRRREFFLCQVNARQSPGIMQALPTATLISRWVAPLSDAARFQSLVPKLFDNKTRRKDTSGRRYRSNPAFCFLSLVRSNQLNPKTTWGNFCFVTCCHYTAASCQSHLRGAIPQFRCSD